MKVNRLLLNNIDVRGRRLGRLRHGAARLMREQWDRLVPMMECGVVDPPIGRTYAFDEMGAALHDLASRRTLGKAVVVL